MKRAITFLLLLASIGSFAQDNIFLFRVGIGTYSMKSQKQFQTEFIRESGLPLRVVDNFPSYPSFGGSLGFRTSEKSITGISYEYSSTGGRLHYKDYSGEAQMDQLLSASQIGAFYQIRINHSEDWPLYFRVQGSIVLSQLTIINELTIWNDSTEEEFSFKSKNLTLQPGLVAQKNISGLVFQAGFGVELSTHGIFYLEDDKEAQLYTYSGDEVTAQWDGLRAFIGIGFLLNSKSTTNHTSQ